LGASAAGLKARVDDDLSGPDIMDGIVMTPEVERALDGKPPTPVAAVAAPASAPALAPVPSTADGSQAVALDPEPSTPEPSAQLEASGASTETDAAAAAAPAAFAPEGSTGGAATRPRDHEDVSPNKIPLKKPSVVKHSVSDPTKQHLTFDAAAAPAAAAAAAAAAE
jgi:hypothetical protein